MLKPGYRAAAFAIALTSPFLLAPRGALAQASDSNAANGTGSGTASDSGGTADQSNVTEVVVAAQRLNAARSQIQSEIGASAYTITNEAIAASPGGQNVQLNQVLLQAPDVVQDSFGQLHIRGDHNDLQYRLNGIILPEGISVFSQTLDPRLISSLSLLTGALPAEFGLRTAGIIDVTTDSGLLQPGGYLSFYGGSDGEIQPAAAVSGSAGSFSYFLSASMLKNDLGIESPDGSPNPLHDHTDQLHGFAYLEDILGPNDRVSLILGSSDEFFQIPNQRGLEPSLGYVVNGVSDFLSDDLNETQHELTQYAIGSWQHSQGAFNIQTSLSARFTSLHFEPDWVGDLLFNGIAQNAFKDDTAVALQTDGSYQVNDAHTVRAGVYLQHDSSMSETTSQVLRLCAPPLQPSQCPPNVAFGMPVSDVPETIIDNGQQSQQIESAYLQDEWQALSSVTINYGLRFDHYSAYSSGSQLSPRLNVVWQPFDGTTLHAGYSRYFTPPPFELIASETFAKFAGTSALPPGSVTEDTRPVAERANYYDAGIEQKLLDKTLTLGVDAYGKTATNLIDEGQFGAPIILTPFNYRWGRIGGVEFTENYSAGNLSLYSNLAFQSAKGKGVASSQFNFTQEQLAYIANNWIHLDHEERVSASAGASYLWHGTRLSVDSFFGTGLREDWVLPDGEEIPNGQHTGSYTVVNLGLTHIFGAVTLRFDVMNLLDKEYYIRSGTGIGVFAPQFGARRGFFGGVTWAF